MNDTALPTTEPAVSEPSLWRAWFYLVWLSWQRQLRARQMVWIALTLLAFAVIFVALNTLQGRWDLRNRRWPQGDLDGLRREGRERQRTIPVQSCPCNQLGVVRHAEPDHRGSVQLVLQRFSLQVYVFVNAIVFGLFLNFLLPLWSMSFATEALGGDRESNSLIWLLTRPLPRPAIYLAKFVAMLPWSLALNLGGFGLLCLLAGPPGRETFKLLWPAVLCGALAFSSLFFLIGAFFRRPAIVAIVYTFFLESILGNMPGYLKRVSINFYTRCMMYDALEAARRPNALARRVFPGGRRDGVHRAARRDLVFPGSRDALVRSKRVS